MIKFEAGQQVEVRVFNEDTQKSEWVTATVDRRIEKGNVVAYDVTLPETADRFEESLTVYQGGVANEIR